MAGNKHNSSDENIFDNTKIISRVNRRIDSLAKIIKCTAICSAVAVVSKKNSNVKELIISSNNLKKDVARKLTTCFTKNFSPYEDKDLRTNHTLECKQAFLLMHLSNIFQDKLLTKQGASRIDCVKTFVLQGEISRLLKNDKQSYDNLDEFINYPGIKKNEREKLIKKLTDNTSLNIEYKNFTKNLVSNNLNIKEFEDFLNLKSDFLNLFVGNKKIFNKTKDLFRKLENINNEVKNLVEKVMTLKDHEELKELIVNKRFHFIGSDNNEHAEMNIIKHLVINGYEGDFYIGISKFTCFNCTNDIMAINASCLPINLYTRGAHNVDYSETRFKTMLIKSYFKEYSFSEEGKKLLAEQLYFMQERFSNLEKYKPGKTSEYYNESDSEVIGQEPVYNTYYGVYD